MTRPLIAVTADNKEVAPYMWHATPSPYVDAALDAADALPMILPSVGDRIGVDEILDRVDGVLVDGRDHGIDGHTRRAGVTLGQRGPG